ncbi:MAG: hypothetical protein JXJ04_15755 [Spirochaetales bacterium]|nr:hypothetical protein [Spirochaetales bacterium]
MKKCVFFCFLVMMILFIFTGCEPSVQDMSVDETLSTHVPAEENAELSRYDWNLGLLYHLNYRNYILQAYNYGMPVYIEYKWVQVGQSGGYQKITIEVFGSPTSTGVPEIITSYIDPPKDIYGYYKCGIYRIRKVNDILSVGKAFNYGWAYFTYIKL